MAHGVVVVNDLILFFWRLSKKSILDKGGMGHFAVAGFSLGCRPPFPRWGWGWGWSRLHMVMKDIMVTWCFVVIMAMLMAVVVTV